MGASLSWFAFRGKTPGEVLQAFGLRNAGKGYCDTPFCGGLLPSGWYLVIHGGHEFTSEEARRLSRDCEVVACFVDEHVMVSRADGWNNGEGIWSVMYGEQGDEHLDVEGKPPAGFVAIRDRLTKHQEEEGGADFFSIPVGLAKEITGYGHNDSLPGISFDNFVKPTFFQKLFGR